jgi:hypothetical protein
LQAASTPARAVRVSSRGLRRVGWVERVRGSGAEHCAPTAPQALGAGHGVGVQLTEPASWLRRPTSQVSVADGHCSAPINAWSGPIDAFQLLAERNGTFNGGLRLVRLLSAWTRQLRQFSAAQAPLMTAGHRDRHAWTPRFARDFPGRRFARRFHRIGMASLMSLFVEVAWYPSSRKLHADPPAERVHRGRIDGREGAGGPVCPVDCTRLLAAKTAVVSRQGFQLGTVGSTAFATRAFSAPLIRCGFRRRHVGSKLSCSRCQ